MTDHTFFDGRVVLKPGDCRDRLKELPDNSIDAVVTDPPYHLVSIVKRFGGPDAAPATPKEGAAGAYARSSRGFMNKTWDGGDIAFQEELWAEVLRVLKPGGHMVAFSGDRTYHRMAVAIEDAGFEIRHSMLDVIASDTAVLRFMETLSEEQCRAFLRCIEESEFGGMLAYCYGSGFPKAHDVAKGIDRMLGVDREVIGTETIVNDMRNSALLKAGKGGEREAYEREVTVATSELAKKWTGWKSALKPAFEPICLARKPLSESSIAANVVKWGTGALNIDACRVDAEKPTGWGGKAAGGGTWNEENNGLGKDGAARPVLGRFPSNIITDGSPEVMAAFPETPGATGTVTGKEASGSTKNTHGTYADRATSDPRMDSGSAARFFYASKADGDDRLGSKHPTVKNTDLIRYLVRLICPKGGVVLDPFAGTGTTGYAAYWEGCDAILIEREEEYQADIAKRMKLVLAGPDEKKRARTEVAPVDGLPLFS